MRVAIVEYAAGNIYSVVHAVERLAAAAVVSSSPAVLRAADKVILPGQGACATVLGTLRARGLDSVLLSLRCPVLAICVGQQVLCAYSEEGSVAGLGLFDVCVRRFPAPVHDEKVPHMGWDTLTALRSPLFTDIAEGSYAYFVHSYYVPVCAYTIATCDYLVPFSAALCRDNFYATQFHPEKSGSVGESILRNFLAL